MPIVSYGPREKMTLPPPVLEGFEKARSKLNFICNLFVHQVSFSY